MTGDHSRRCPKDVPDSPWNADLVDSKLTEADCHRSAVASTLLKLAPSREDQPAGRLGTVTVSKSSLRSVVAVAGVPVVMRIGISIEPCVDVTATMKSMGVPGTKLA